MFNLVSARTPVSHLEKLLSSWVTDNIQWYKGLFPHRCKTLQFLFAEFHDVPVSRFSSLLRSLSRAVQPSGTSATPPSFVIQTNWLEGLTHLSFLRWSIADTRCNVTHTCLLAWYVTHINDEGLCSFCFLNST